MSNKPRHTFKRNELIDQIIDMRINKGWTTLTIMKFLQNDLGYSEVYSYELIRNAREDINNKSIQIFGEAIKEDIERFESLYQTALLNKDRKEARELLKEISKLKGHYVERIDVSGKIEHNIEVIKIISPPDNGIGT